MELWLAARLAGLFGSKVGPIIARVFTVCLMVAIVVGPYIVIYQKLKTSEAEMAEVTTQLAQEQGKREALERDLITAKEEAAGIRQDMEALGRSLDHLNSRYAAAVGRVSKLEKFLSGVDWNDMASKNPEEAKALLNNTITELWHDAETVTGAGSVRH